MKTRHTFTNVTHFRDRHGKVRWRYRKNGFTVSLGSDYGSDEFLQRLSAAQKGKRVPRGQTTSCVLSGSVRGSLSAVIESWYQTAAFKMLAPSTQNGYRYRAEALRENHGHKLVQNLQRRHVKAIMADKADTPSAANHDRRVLCFLLDQAMDLELVETNVARSVKNLRTPDGGYHTWTEPEIEQFLDTHKEGTVPRVAMTLMLYTGAGRSDAAALGPHSIISGRIQYRRQKMVSRGGVLVDIPMHPELISCVEPLLHTDTFLQTNAGKQRSPKGLGMSMRDWCDKAALPQCSSHGLRKACARRLIEAGATPHEMMAVTGHKTLAEAQRYAETFNRSAAADAAIEKQTL